MNYYTCPKCGGFSVIKSTEKEIQGASCSCGSVGVTLVLGKVKVDKPSAVAGSKPLPVPAVAKPVLPNPPVIFNPSAQVIPSAASSVNTPVQTPVGSVPIVSTPAAPIATTSTK